MHASDRESFDWDHFDALCRARGWDRPVDRAKGLGVHIGTITRIETGELRPGLRFANKCRRVFGLENYVKLFPLPTSEETSDANS